MMKKNELINGDQSILVIIIQKCCMSNTSEMSCSSTSSLVFPGFPGDFYVFTRLICLQKFHFFGPKKTKLATFVLNLSNLIILAYKIINY